MTEIKLQFPPGHFYSPVVDPNSVNEYVRNRRQAGPLAIQGVEIDVARMRSFWEANTEFISSLRVGSRDHGRRYHTNNASFGLGDAIVLSAMINAYKPAKIIEIGSGFSTACMLDAADTINLSPFHVTCIEPYPDRLRSLLKPADLGTVTIIESPVQAVPIEQFARLTRGDILFIDSTHVLKTGSDVHYEIMHILPILAEGVIVHFHDIQFPFEYPDPWIYEENFSWNEIYAVHAFLMFNSRFQIIFFNNFFGRFCSDLVTRTVPSLARFPESFGGSLWIERRSTNISQ